MKRERERSRERCARASRAGQQQSNGGGGGGGGDGGWWSASIVAPPTHPQPHPPLTLREGGVAGVEGGPAPKERCLPPPGRQKEDAAGGQDVLACAWNRHGQSQWISKRTRQRQRQMQRMGLLVTLFACAWTRHGQWLCKKRNRLRLEAE